MWGCFRHIRRVLLTLTHPVCHRVHHNLPTSTVTSVRTYQKWWLAISFCLFGKSKKPLRQSFVIVNSQRSHRERSQKLSMPEWMLDKLPVERAEPVHRFCNRTIPFPNRSSNDETSQSAWTQFRSNNKTEEKEKKTFHLTVAHFLCNLLNYFEQINLNDWRLGQMGLQPRRVSLIRFAAGNEWSLSHSTKHISKWWSLSSSAPFILIISNRQWWWRRRRPDDRTCVNKL